MTDEERARAWREGHGVGSTIVDACGRAWRVVAWDDGCLPRCGGGCVLRCDEIDLERGATALEIAEEELAR